MKFSPSDVRTKVLGYLKSKNIPTNSTLPLLDGHVFKSSIEVGKQIIVLYSLAGLANEADTEAVKEWLIANKVYSEMEEFDRIYFEKSKLTEQELIDLSWKQESLFALSWCGRLVESLSLPFGECNLDRLFSKIPPEVEVKDFLKDFTLRSDEEIAFQVDLHYCLHWAVRHPESWKKTEALLRLNMDVILQRRRSFEWISRASAVWDEVLLDT